MTKISINKLSREIIKKRENISVNALQVRKVINLTLEELSKESPSDVLKLLEKYY